MAPREGSIERDMYEEGRDYDAGVVTHRTWKGAIWDTFDLPPKERKLLFKVDAILITLASVSFPRELRGRFLHVQLGYFIKNLDQTNINSAVSLPAYHA